MKVYQFSLIAMWNNLILMTLSEEPLLVALWAISSIMFMIVAVFAVVKNI